MTNCVSINKIKSLKQHIEQTTGESYSDLTEAIQALKNGYGASGGSSGIIDVTELPTSGIDENAVYRVTETVQTEKTEVYLVANSSVVNVQQYLVSLGVSTVPNMYVVDNLSNMLESDVQTFSTIHLYILRSDGIVYLNAPVYGGIVTLGLLGFQANGYDKGFTKNIYDETKRGVYTTVEAFKDVVRYFIRENGEWKEVTAYSNGVTASGFTNVDVYSGDITSKVFSVADVVSGECTELDESWFIKSNGETIKTIREYLFCKAKLIRVTIPHFIKVVEGYSFYDCQQLTTVTFKGKPKEIQSGAFVVCPNLTTVNVPWSEGEVDRAPWGATYATINYNYTEG